MKHSTQCGIDTQVKTQYNKIHHVLANDVKNKEKPSSSDRMFHIVIKKREQ